jgi:hypothetical protein
VYLHRHWGLVIFCKITHASNRTFLWFFGLVSRMDGVGSIGPWTRICQGKRHTTQKLTESHRDDSERDHLSSSRHRVLPDGPWEKIDSNLLERYKSMGPDHWCDWEKKDGSIRVKEPRHYLAVNHDCLGKPREDK